MRKICVVITARASYARVKSFLGAIRDHVELELQLVIAASALLDRFGDAVSVIEGDGFKPDARVYMVVEGENLTTSAKSTGMGVMELATVFDNLKPDAVVTVADRYETLATAIAASYMNIPLVHIQGGEVTGSIDEKVRHAVTKLADIHFPATPRAREWIIRMGEDQEAVFHVGCPSIDLAADVLARPALDFDPIQKYGGVGNLAARPERYIIVMQHPVTTEFGQAGEQMEETLAAVHDSGATALWFWPNIDAGSDQVSNAMRSFREKYDPPNIQFFKNMAPHDFLRLSANSDCIVGNSSVAIRECSFLGVPAVNIGSRQCDREHGPNIVNANHDRDEIIAAIRSQIAGPRPTSSQLYGNGDAGRKMAEILASVPLRFSKRLTYVTGATG